MKSRVTLPNSDDVNVHSLKKSLQTRELRNNRVCVCVCDVTWPGITPQTDNSVIWNPPDKSTLRCPVRKERSARVSQPGYRIDVIYEGNFVLSLVSTFEGRKYLWGIFK